MKISHVYLIKRRGEKGLGRYTEQDLIDQYVTCFSENLEDDRVQHTVIKPGEFICENSLVFDCFGGWLDAKTMPKSNLSTINCGNSESELFAKRLRESVSEWGKCYVDLDHRTTNVSIDEKICSVPKTFSVALSPLKINGPKVEEYMKRIEQLGKILASCVFAFLVSRSEQPKMMQIDTFKV